MTYAALDDVDDAIDATRAFLLPLDAGRWLRLAVIAFFVGGVGSLGSSAGSGGGGGGGGGGPESMAFPDAIPDLALSDPLVAGIVAVLVLVGLVWLGFALIGAVMEFVLVEAVRREAVELRRYTGRYWRGGLRLFGFRIGVSLLVVAVGLAVIGAGVLAAGGLAALETPARLLAILALALPVLFVLGLVSGLVLGLTTDFVVPVMVLEGTTVLGGWRRFWPTLRADWREYVVYVVVAFLLRLAAGVVVGLVVGIVAVVLALPLGAVGLAAFVVGGGQIGWPLLVVIAALVLVFVLAIMALSALVRVPVVTYFRYYALLVLGDTEPSFDLVADRRAAIRDEA